VGSKNGRNLGAIWRFSIAKLVVSALLFAAPAFAADSIQGQVLGSGAPIAKSTVTLWSTSADAPKQLAQTQTGDDGRFTLSATLPLCPLHPCQILTVGDDVWPARISAPLSRSHIRRATNPVRNIRPGLPGMRTQTVS